MSSETTAQILDGHLLEAGGGAKLLVDGEEFINFAGCNYLALSDVANLRDVAHEAIDQGALFSKYLVKSYGGTDQIFEDVEAAAAEYFGTEEAVYMPSGYHIGMAGVAALAPLYDCIVKDKVAHWCLEDAARLSGVPLYEFSHRNPDSLADVLKTLPSGIRPLVITDGAFATSGALAPLDAYEKLVELYDGHVFVDESHSAGVVGEHGRGAADHFNCGPRVHVSSTLSKGLCGHGAVFVGTKEQVQLAREAKPLRGSTPGSPISAAVSAAALRYAQNHPGRAAELRQKTASLRQSLRGMGLEIEETPASILAFSLGSFDQNRHLQKVLFENKIYVLHSNYIAAGKEGLIRLSIFADHTPEQLDRFVSIIKEML